MEWEWWHDHNTSRLFIHLILTANHKETKHCGHSIPRGARVAGYPKLSKETGLSVQELRTASAKLKSTGEITGKSTGSFSIITVCNYDKYQSNEIDDQQENQQASQLSINRLPTGGVAQSAVNSSLNEPLRMEEVKKETTLRKSAGESARFAEFWAAYPKKKSKVDAAKAWKQSKGDSIFNEILDGLGRAVASADWQKDDGRFIPYPASWLRAGGWMDEAGSPTMKTCENCRHNHQGACSTPGTRCDAWAGESEWAQ